MLLDSDLFCHLTALSPYLIGMRQLETSSRLLREPFATNFANKLQILNCYLIGKRIRDCRTLARVTREFLAKFGLNSPKFL